MNEKQLERLKIWFRAYTDAFTAEHGQLPLPLQLKFEHSRRVAEDLRRIAGDLQWPEEDIRTAEALGWLHDAARYPQFARFKTFHDPRSLNHGEYGWRILQQFDVLADCPEPARSRILDGVRYHNRKQIPEEAAAATAPFVRLIRDGDKLDIYAVVDQAIEQDQFREYPELLLHYTLSSDPNPDLLEEIGRDRVGSYEHVKSITDFLLLQLSWVYDIGYKATYRLMEERGVLDRLERRMPREPHVLRLVERARRHVREKITAT